MVWNGLITFLNLIPRTTIDFIGLLYVSKAQVILFVIHSDYYTSSKDVQQQAIENGHHLVSHLHFQPTAVWSHVCHFPLLSFNSPTQRGRLQTASVSSEDLLVLLSLICPLFCWAGEFFFSCEPSPPPFSVPIEQVCLLFWDWAHASAFVCFLLLW